MQRSMIRLAIGLVVWNILCPGVSQAQPPDPIVGTWKLNLAKSKYTIPAPKSMAVTVAPAARGYLITVEAVGADGMRQNWSYTSTFDGSESVVSGNPGIDSVVARSDGAEGRVTYKKSGRVITTTTSVISEDRKMMTVTIKVPDGQGNEITSVAVYDRQ